LGFLAKGKQRVLPGFITTKTAELENVDDLKRKFDEASKYVDMDQLGIAPQCGFASTEEGNHNINKETKKRSLTIEKELTLELLIFRSCGIKHEIREVMGRRPIPSPPSTPFEADCDNSLLQITRD